MGVATLDGMRGRPPASRHFEKVKFMIKAGKVNDFYFEAKSTDLRDSEDFKIFQDRVRRFVDLKQSVTWRMLKDEFPKQDYWLTLAIDSLSGVTLIVEKHRIPERIIAKDITRVIKKTRHTPDYAKLTELARSGLPKKEAAKKMGMHENTFYRRMMQDGSFAKAWDEGKVNK